MGKERYKNATMEKKLFGKDNKIKREKIKYFFKMWFVFISKLEISHILINLIYKNNLKYYLYTNQ